MPGPCSPRFGVGSKPISPGLLGGKPFFRASPDDAITESDSEIRALLMGRADTKGSGPTGAEGRCPGLGSAGARCTEGGGRGEDKGKGRGKGPPCNGA